MVAAALAPTYAGFTACRTLQGLFNTPPQVIGLSIIHDMFFFHKRARKINIWAFSFFCGPFLGPFISGLLVERISWRAVYGVLAGLHGLAVLLIVIFGDETLYDRIIPVADTPSRGVTGLRRLTKRPNRVLRLVGHKPPASTVRPSLWTSTKHTFQIAVLPQLLLPTAIWTCIDFMWAIGIITTITQFVKPPPYLFSDSATALIYLAPFTGVLIAEAYGHFLNDFLQNHYIRRHGGRHKAENRLWALYPVICISVGGLLLYGQTLQHHLHWIGLAVGWAMYAGGFLAGTTIVSAYVLDSFPKHAAAASSWVNFWRTAGKRLVYSVSLFGLAAYMICDRWIQCYVFSNRLGESDMGGEMEEEVQGCGRD